MKTIFEDNYLKIINKPAGVISTAISPLICHRLDRDTSGLLIIAKSQKIKRAIQEQFKARRVKKTYLGLFLGRIIPPKGEIKGYIVRHKKDPNKRRFVRALASGVKEAHKRESISKYKVLKYFGKEIFKNKSQKDLNKMTLGEIKIKTGRTHQIRVQFASLHHPTIGDEMYGGKIMKKIKEALNIKRQFLHAYKLKFRHPMTGEKIKVKSELPDDLENIINSLNKIK